MAAISHAAEYAAVREAIQQLTTLDSSGARRDFTSISVGDLSFTYAANQIDWLQKRERELAKRLSIRNVRKRTISSFGNDQTSTLPV
jgi:hypothetical protein